MLPARLQGPAQLADPLGRELVRAGDDDGVGTGRVHDGPDAVDPGELVQGEARQLLIGAESVGSTGRCGHRADELVAGLGAAPQLARRVQHARARAEEDHLAREAAVPPLAGEPRAPAEPADADQEDARRERGDDVAARQEDLQQVGDDRDDPEEPDRAVDDAAVLDVARADDPAVAGVEDLQGEEPGGRQHDRDPGVVDRDVDGVVEADVGVEIEVEPDELGAEHGDEDGDDVGDEESAAVVLLPRRSALRRDPLRRHRSPLPLLLRGPLLLLRKAYFRLR